YGVQVLDQSAQMLIMYNTVRQNGGGGIYIYEGEMNLVTGNTIAENQNFNARDNGGNKWLGNFYGDYSGEDLNGDEVGDEPYVILGSRGVASIDSRPFMAMEWLDVRGPS
ncbi:MAG TPA: right-handed parallel beta-helix repeat-containing protein, partial [Methanothrix sp.]|nr:right-handed parallel beta-helix repeat-containing protein [Methanothrix sp.]